MGRGESWDHPQKAAAYERGYREGYRAAMERMQEWSKRVLLAEKPPVIQLCGDCPHTPESEGE